MSIDFNHSSIAWHTTSNSLGEFKIEAVLSKPGSRDFYLSSAVMAGDVYGKGLLPREPQYHFLWATDGHEAIIYRIHENEKVAIGDKASTTIKSLSTKVSDAEYQSIELESLHCQQNLIVSNLVCQLNISDDVLTFPVKHINLLKEKKLFQIETGPIVFRNNGDIVPGFVFINSLNSCQIVPFYPRLGETPLALSSCARFFTHA